MSYFRANERYLSGDPDPRVEPPWGVSVQDAGMAGRVRVAWRRPYSPVDSYGVYGQPAPPGAVSEWRELLRVPGAATDTLLYLGPESWRLAVRARRGTMDSELSEVVVWNVEPEVRNVEFASDPDSHSSFLIPHSSPPPPAPEPACPQPGCGARVAVRPDGGTACVYCGCVVAITPDGRALALDRLLYGACTCCVPCRPLIRQGDALICPARPERRYGLPVALGDGREAANPAPPPGPPPQTPVPEPAPEFDWQAIDTALRDNSARLGRHGLFVRET